MDSEKHIDDLDPDELVTEGDKYEIKVQRLRDYIARNAVTGMPEELSPPGKPCPGCNQLCRAAVVLTRIFSPKLVR